MEESDRESNSVSETERRLRVEYLFETIKKENPTFIELIYLSGFLLSFCGIITNMKFLQMLAKTVFGMAGDLDKENIDFELFSKIIDYKLYPDGIPHRNNSNRESQEIPRDTPKDARVDSSIQGKD